MRRKARPTQRVDPLSEPIAPGSNLSQRDVYNAAETGDIDTLDKALQGFVDARIKGKLLVGASKNGQVMIVDRLLQESDISTLYKDLAIYRAVDIGNRHIIYKILFTMTPAEQESMYHTIPSTARSAKQYDIFYEFIPYGMSRQDLRYAALHFTEKPRELFDITLYYASDEDLSELLDFLYKEVHDMKAITRVRREIELRKDPKQYEKAVVDVYAVRYGPTSMITLDKIDSVELDQGLLSPECYALSYQQLRLEALDGFISVDVDSLCRVVSEFQERITLEGNCVDLDLDDLVGALEELIYTLSKRQLCHLVDILYQSALESVSKQSYTDY